MGRRDGTSAVSSMLDLSISFPHSRSRPCGSPSSASSPASAIPRRFRRLEMSKTEEGSGIVTLVASSSSSSALPPSIPPRHRRIPAPGRRAAVVFVGGVLNFNTSSKLSRMDVEVPRNVFVSLVPLFWWWCVWCVWYGTSSLSAISCAFAVADSVAQSRCCRAAFDAIHRAIPVAAGLASSWQERRFLVDVLAERGLGSPALSFDVVLAFAEARRDLLVSIVIPFHRSVAALEAVIAISTLDYRCRV